MESVMRVARLMRVVTDCHRHHHRHTARAIESERASAATAAARVPIVGGTGNGDDARDARR